jgi:hypothetical protein
MRPLIKITLCYFLFNIINLDVTTAQIFHPKDSVRKQRVMQVGVGVYYGINHITPITPNFRYFTNDGYDKGILMGLRVNLTKHFVLDANYRISQQTCMIGMQNEAFYESFHLTGNSLNIPLILRYNILKNQQNILTLLMGIAYQKTRYSASNPVYDLVPGYLSTTRSGVEFIDGSNTNYWNYTIGISKEIYLSQNTQFSVFTEVSLFNNPIVKENGVRKNNQNVIDKYFTEFKQWNSRIGISFLL